MIRLAVRWKRIADLIRLTRSYLTFPRDLSPSLADLLSGRGSAIRLSSPWSPEELFLWADCLSSIDKITGRPTCLKRALLLYQAFSATGVTVELRLGVERESGEGHAWVVVDGTADLAPGGEERFRVVARFPPSPPARPVKDLEDLRYLEALKRGNSDLG